MRVSRTAVAALMVTAIVSILLLMAPSAQAKDRGCLCNPGVYPPQSKPFGLSYGDWGARWWQWLATTPVAPSEGTGTNTGEGQHGPVWFLGWNQTVTWLSDGVGVGTADWTVTMPAGKAIFFPVWSTEADVASGNGTTYAELAANNDLWVAHVTELAATVDGRPLRSLFAYRAGSSLFELQWLADNLWQFDPAAPTDAVSDGFWIMLAPLRVGHHVVHTEGTMVWPEYSFTFTTGFTFHITVTPKCR